MVQFLLRGVEIHLGIGLEWDLSESEDSEVLDLPNLGEPRQCLPPPFEAALPGPGIPLLIEPGEVPTGEDPRSKASTALVTAPRASEEGWSVLLSKWSHTLDSSSRALARTGNERLLPFWNFLFNQKCRGKTCRITLPRIVISATATPVDGHSRPVWLSGDEVQVELNNLMDRAKQLWGGFLGDMFWGFWILGAHLLRFS